MKGMPKVLATKQDYLNVIQLFPRSMWEPVLRQLLSDRYYWVPIGATTPEDGIIDNTHRVDESTDDDGNIVYYQMEKQVNPNAKIFRIGFTVSEVNGLL